MKAAVVIFPGSNRERDICAALAGATGHEPTRVWHRDTVLPATDLIVLPGGFAYGDYLRCGAIAAQSPIMRAVHGQAGRGTPVLGICNGFQILTEAGLLPGALLPNRSLRFTCRDVHLRVENNQTIFTCGYEAGQMIRVPVAHHDGNYQADGATLDRLEGEGRVAFRYLEDVNGSARNIAGILNESRNVLGLMPHPERHVLPTQHPRWTRQGLAGEGDGLRLFRNAVGYFLQ